jgi:hypothetical protein
MIKSFVLDKAEAPTAVHDNVTIFRYVAVCSLSPTWTRDTLAEVQWLILSQC